MTANNAAFERERDRRVALQGYCGQLRSAIQRIAGEHDAGDLLALEVAIREALTIQAPEGV